MDDELYEKGREGISRGTRSMLTIAMLVAQGRQ
jgi:alkylhydroperoxidase/carboxymuconolactone decarboxylase family protein YurZ